MMTVRSASPAGSHQVARLNLRSLARRLVSSETGLAAVEFAAVMPVLFGFLFGIMELGRGLWIQNSLQYAVEAGARCAALDSTACDTEEKVQVYTARQVGQYNIPIEAFTVTEPACGKLVVATYPFTSAVGGFVNFKPTLRASSCHPAAPD